MRTEPYGLKPSLFNAIYAQATPEERKKMLHEGLSSGRMAALAIDAALAQNKNSGGRALSEALVSWAARHMERAF